MVGDAGLIAIDAAGDGEHPVLGGGAGFIQVVLRGVGERREIGHHEFAHAVVEQRHGGRGIGQREARVGTTDVGEEDPIGVAHAANILCGAGRLPKGVRCIRLVDPVVRGWSHVAWAAHDSAHPCRRQAGVRADAACVYVCTTAQMEVGAAGVQRGGRDMGGLDDKVDVRVSARGRLPCENGYMAE